MHATESLSLAILETVAEYKDTDVEKLDSPLHEAIDPEALDSLFRSTTGALTFSYDEFIVTVDHEGSVDLDPVTMPPADFA